MSDKLITSADYGSSHPFARGAWRKCSGPSLRGHIVNGHFHPRALFAHGIPLLDIQIARERDFTLEWVISKAVELLLVPDDVLKTEAWEVQPELYRLGLIKTMRVIDDFGLATAPWENLEATFPGAAEVAVDLARDARDISFERFLDMGY